ncbi:IS66 family transposase [Myxococcota bacterium]
MGRKRAKGSRKTARKRKPAPKRREVRLEELKAILARARTAPLSEEDLGKLEGAVDTLAFLTQELEAKGASIKRLRKLIFGASTEKTSQVTGKPTAGSAGGADSADEADGAAATGDGGSAADADEQKKTKPKRKGHGRNGAADYRGAEKVKVAHESLKRGDACPECPKGKLYPLADPAVLVRVTGMAPLNATVYELERLRCNLCGMVFTARAPEGVGTVKYDETAAAMIALLKYGSGLPFNRLERLQRGLGIPLPASTQWEVVKAAADPLTPAYDEIIRQAAQGDVLHNDDTTMRILDLMGIRREKALAKGELEDEDRTGIFTSGIVSTTEDHRIAVFFTGRQHAGENLADMLAKRAKELAPPIQMSDALSRNAPGDIETIVAYCIAHARRKFVDVAENFPDQVRHVLEELRKVYKNDSFARKQQMSPDERLLFHQQQSGPVMDDLEEWLQKQLDEKQVEPNSTLGEAIGYMQEHWKKLTLFLQVPGAPLDNNIVERSLKKAILHRKNAYFYRSEDGARVGDVFMSLIYTAELCGADPFDYLVCLQRHADAVAGSPSDWMPWSYRATVDGFVDTG